MIITLCPGGTNTGFFEASYYGTRNFPGGLQTPEEAVRAALKAVDRRGAPVVSRRLNKLTLISERFIPRSSIVKAAAGLFKV